MSAYVGIGPEAGKFVPEEKAYDYAWERCTSGPPDEQKEFKTFIGLFYYIEMSGWKEAGGVCLGIGSNEGIFVSYEKAYEYALFRCIEWSFEERKEFREAFVEWYYSGNWIKEDLIAEDRNYCVSNYKGRTA